MNKVKNLRLKDLKWNKRETKTVSAKLSEIQQKNSKSFQRQKVPYVQKHKSYCQQTSQPTQNTKNRAVSSKLSRKIILILEYGSLKKINKMAK